MKEAEAFFTAEEKERIRQAVVRAEARSSGEIVPMVVDQSGHYIQFALTGAIFFAFLVAVVWMTIWRPVTAPQLLLIELFAFWVAFFLIQRIRRLWSWLVPESLKERVVRRRALEGFYAHRLHETRDQTGVLILLSLMEHRVELLADAGIHQRVSPEIWERLVQQIASGVKEGRPVEGLAQAIDACGALLAEHFPRRADDINELPNDLQIDP
ncbi:MAG: TPM domain-containing protein [Nitrospirae bacterium]|nr:TPM domain-containing protein [Candidatus Manganitrophaceae bacterium]